MAMNERRSSTEFPLLPIKSDMRCWQIDDQRLESPLDNGRWLDRIIENLIIDAKEHPDQTLYGATWVGPSVEFGWMGSSTWLAFTGSKLLRDRAAKTVAKVLPGNFVKEGITYPSQTNWTGVLYIRDGHAWQPLDAVEWFRVNPKAKARSNAQSKAPG